MEGALIHISCELLHQFKLVEELTDEHPENGVRGNRYDHTHNSSYVSSHYDDQENLKRMGLYTLGVDEWLKNDIVNS